VKSILKKREGSTCDAAFCVVLFVCVCVCARARVRVFFSLSLSLSKVLFYCLHFFIVIVGLHAFCWCVLERYVLAECLLSVFCMLFGFLLLHCDFSTYRCGSTNLLGDWLSLLCYCPIHNLFTIWTNLSQLSLLVKAIQSAVCVAINWPAGRLDCVNISH
jgi:hypothetical protein